LGDFVVFWKKQKGDESIKTALRDVQTIGANNAGATRRATGMVPIASGDHEIAHTGSVKFHQLLVSLEGNQRTGCLRIISPRRKSRSAILIYRGRVVGCLYGSRKIDAHYLQQDAHQFALADLASPGNVLDAYELPEELVLAAASLFSGETIKIESYQTAADMLDQGMRHIAETQLPGCAVVSTTDDEMVCMVYLYGGKIIGVFSATDGWASPTYETAMKYTKGVKSTKVMAACLPVSDKQLAVNIGFSLTGLADALKRNTNAPTCPLQAVDSFVQIGNQSHNYSNRQPAMAQNKPSGEIYTRWSPEAISTNQSHNVFAIIP
jgi:hypothetical protein